MTDIDLTAWEPQDAVERHVSAQAIESHRRSMDGHDALVALTPFERILAARAYEAGRQEVTDAVREGIGPAAVTVDAQAIVRIADRAGSRIDFGASSLGRRLPEGALFVSRSRFAESIVAGARREADQLATDAEGSA